MRDNVELPEGLLDYNLLTGLETPLKIETIDFDDLAKNFDKHIKSIDGNPKKTYDKHLALFDDLHKKKILAPLKNLIAYKPRYMKAVVIDIGSFLEGHVEGSTRLKLLNHNFDAISELINKGYIDKYEYTFDLMIFLSMLVNIKIHGPNHKATKAMIRTVEAGNTIEAGRAIRTIRQSKSAKGKLSHLIFGQIVMLLIEFPFKDHQVTRSVYK